MANQIYISSGEMFEVIEVLPELAQSTGGRRFWVRAIGEAANPIQTFENADDACSAAETLDKGRVSERKI